MSYERLTHKSSEPALLRPRAIGAPCHPRAFNFDSAFGALRFQIRQYQAVRWFRRGARSTDEGDSPIPLGVSQLEAARQVVAALVADPPETDAEIEGVEVVRLRSGHWPTTATHGVAMQWRKGRQKFGLLMPIERLAHQAGGLDGVPFYLGLAVDEPHDSGDWSGTRTWFTDLPSGPY